MSHSRATTDNARPAAGRAFVELAFLTHSAGPFMLLARAKLGLDRRLRRDRRLSADERRRSAATALDISDGVVRRAVRSFKTTTAGVAGFGGLDPRRD
jgi:hypothetical protein